MKTKCLRSVENNSLEIVVKYVSQKEVVLELYRVYGTKYDDDGETFDLLVAATHPYNGEINTFDDAAKLLFNDMCKEIERLMFDLRCTKNKLHKLQDEQEGLPF